MAEEDDRIGRDGAGRAAAGTIGDAAGPGRTVGGTIVLVLLKLLALRPIRAAGEEAGRRSCKVAVDDAREGGKLASGTKKSCFFSGGGAARSAYDATRTMPLTGTSRCSGGERRGDHKSSERLRRVVAVA